VRRRIIKIRIRRKNETFIIRRTKKIKVRKNGVKGKIKNIR
jgi:hypothetical protein